MQTTSDPMTGDHNARPRPRRPALDRHVAMRLAAVEYERFLAQLRDLTPDDWGRPTSCPDWDVRLMTCHVIGMAEFAGSRVEQLRQMRAARRAGGLFIDALTALQAAKHADRTTDDLVDRMASVGPRAAKGRRRTPAVARRLRIADQPLDPAGATSEPWTLGYLTDVILTRDTWMHRADIAVATGRTMTLTAEHDGTLVADIAEEWAGRHGQPCTLALSGPAGGTWRWDESGGPTLRLDAVEFCRTISGRGAGEGLLATPVPF